MNSDTKKLDKKLDKKLVQMEYKMNTNKLDKTVQNMLKENTGKHFLDSGFQSGRHWQRNAMVEDFKNTKPVTWEIDTWKDGESTLLITLNIYHYLMGLDLDDRCIAFNAIQDGDKGKFVENTDFYNMTSSGMEFIQELDDLHGVVIGRSWNSYNSENILSQELQGVDLEIDGEYYVMLQVHNGADVRGGYTVSKMFKLNYDGMMPDEQGIYGTIDGVQVDLEGVQLYTETGQEIEITPTSEIELDYYNSFE